LFAWPWSGDIRTLRIGLFAIVTLGCTGLFLGVWSLVGAASFLAAQALFALTPEPYSERKLQKATFWMTWMAVSAVLVGRVAFGAPSLVWVLASAALGGLMSFIGVCFAAKSASPAHKAAGPSQQARG
jgi:hypothetical protein